jgi:hypothetical protein
MESPLTPSTDGRDTPAERPVRLSHVISVLGKLLAEQIHRHSQPTHVDAKESGFDQHEQSTGQFDND